MRPRYIEVSRAAATAGKTFLQWQVRHALWFSKSYVETVNCFLLPSQPGFKHWNISKPAFVFILLPTVLYYCLTLEVVYVAFYGVVAVKL